MLQFCQEATKSFSREKFEARSYEWKGPNGFCYDAVFLPKVGNWITGEMSQDEKAVISNRGIAMRKLITWLREYG